jgi:hypothetical protein
MHLLAVLEQPLSPQGLGRWWKSSEALTVPAQKWWIVIRQFSSQETLRNVFI